MQRATIIMGLFSFLIVAACAAGPRTTATKKIGQTEAVQAASQLTVGMREEDATKSLEQSGLKSGARIGTNQGWYHFFPLTNGISLGLDIRPIEVKPEGAWAGGLLQGAFLQSNGVTFSSIALKSPP